MVIRYLDYIEIPHITLLYANYSAPEGIILQKSQPTGPGELATWKMNSPLPQKKMLRIS